MSNMNANVSGYQVSLFDQDAIAKAIAEAIAKFAVENGLVAAPASAPAAEAAPKMLASDGLPTTPEREQFVKDLAEGKHATVHLSDPLFDPAPAKPARKRDTSAPLGRCKVCGKAWREGRAKCVCGNREGAPMTEAERHARRSEAARKAAATRAGKEYMPEPMKTAARESEPAIDEDLAEAMARVWADNYSRKHDTTYSAHEMDELRESIRSSKNGTMFDTFKREHAAAIDAMLDAIAAERGVAVGSTDDDLDLDVAGDGDDERICVDCRAIYIGAECPKCGSVVSADAAANATAEEIADALGMTPDEVREADASTAELEDIAEELEGKAFADAIASIKGALDAGVAAGAFAEPEQELEPEGEPVAAPPAETVTFKETPNLSKVRRAAERVGPVFLYGPTATGKTSLVLHVAREHVATIHFLPMEPGYTSANTYGIYTKGPSGDWVWQDGPIGAWARAAAEGKRAWLLIDELARGGRTTVAELMPILQQYTASQLYTMGLPVPAQPGPYHVVRIPDTHEVFVFSAQTARVWATSNLGDSYEGLSLNDPAFRNRWTGGFVELAGYDDKTLHSILWEHLSSERALTENQGKVINALIAAHKKVCEMQSKDQIFLMPTNLRSLIAWGKEALRTDDAKLLKQSFILAAQDLIVDMIVPISGDERDREAVKALATIIDAAAVTLA